MKILIINGLLEQLTIINIIIINIIIMGVLLFCEEVNNPNNELYIGVT